MKFLILDFFWLMCVIEVRNATIIEYKVSLADYKILCAIINVSVYIAGSITS